MAAALLIAVAAVAQDKKPASPRQTASGAHASISYGAPSKKGRKLFGAEGLEKFGKVWRSGANEATEIELKQDAKVAGKAVKAGKYAFFTIPNEKEWTIILNSELGQWGAYKYNEAKDVARATVPVKSHTETEQLTYKFEKTGAGEDLHLMWGDTHVVVPIVY